MSELSSRMNWTYPSRDEDPWWDRFVDFVRTMDASGFAAREDRNIILSGGGTLSWDAGGAGLEWTEPFRLFSPSTGYFTLVAPSTLAPADGEVIRFDIVRHPGMNSQVAAEVAPYAENTDNSMLLGMRSGDYFYFRTGLSIADGTVIDAEDFWQGGGGGGFSWKYIPADMRVTIPVNRQMVVQGGITVDGELVIDGELALI